MPRARTSSCAEERSRDAESTERHAELLLDTERVALQALFDMIRRFKVGYDVELHKRTLESALLSLIGPARVATIALTTSVRGPAPIGLPEPENGHASRACEAEPPRSRLDRTPRAPDPHRCGHRRCCSTPTRCRRGQRGTVEAAGAIAVSEAAAEIVRVEHGRPRYGIDLDETTIPQEAGSTSGR